MTGRTRRFLLTMWEGGGTVPPELGVARRLLARGHQVHVLGDPTIAERATSLGCTFSPWTRAPHRTSLDPAQDLLKDWELSNPLAMLRNARDRFMVGPAGEFALDTQEAIATVRPDVLLTDVMLLGAVIAGQAAQLPIAALKPNIWMIPSPGVPAIGPGFPLARSVVGRTRDAAMRMVTNRLFDRGLPALNAVRADHGLPPLTSFWDQVLEVDRILVLTSPTFDFAAPHVPAHVHYAGPVLDDPQWAEPWTPPWPDDDVRPLVLVAFTSNYQDHGPQLRRITDVLSGMPVRAIVTLGQMLDDHEVASTDNVAVVRSAPHSQILPRAALTISHCGHGTTLKSLAAGVPMVCIPMGRDQNDTAARVIHHGAGVRLRPSASTTQIRRAVEQVLRDEQFRTNAERLASIIAQEQQTTTSVVAQLEQLADAVPTEPTP